MNPETGRALWLLLHAYALTYPERAAKARQAEAAAWLTHFGVAVDEATCACGKHWQELLKAHPPKLQGQAAFYWWTVLMHDKINARLGKPMAYPEMQAD